MFAADGSAIKTEATLISAGNGATVEVAGCVDGDTAAPCLSSKDCGGDKGAASLLLTLPDEQPVAHIVVHNDPGNKVCKPTPPASARHVHTRLLRTHATRRVIWSFV